MKRAALTALIVASVAPLACGGPAADSAAGPPTPVLVELYTSEGCSDCPPADELLSRLTATQPIPGVKIVALGEHVDYWNTLGWPDRFSSAAYTQRQSDYQRTVFGKGTIYTPQVVIDGVFQAIGSDRAALRRAVARAAERPKSAVQVTLGRGEAGVLPVTIALTGAPSGPADLLIAVVEDGLVTSVGRGENRGRTLRHDAVVRVLKIAGEIGPGQRDVELGTTLPIADEWRTENVRIVAFVQLRDSRRVLGIGTASLGPTTAAPGD